MADFTTVAQQFTEFYYNTFDADRAGLAALYREDSMLTFETAAIQGSSAIVEKLTSLPFTQVKHQLETMDAQPADANGSILVLVSGKLLVDEEQRPMSYSQVFQLKPNQGSYYVFNDIFKLIYP